MWTLEAGCIAFHGSYRDKYLDLSQTVRVGEMRDAGMKLIRIKY